MSRIPERKREGREPVPIHVHNGEAQHAHNSASGGEEQQTAPASDEEGKHGGNDQEKQMMAPAEEAQEEQLATPAGCAPGC